MSAIGQGDVTLEAVERTARSSAPVVGARGPLYDVVWRASWMSRLV